MKVRMIDKSTFSPCKQSFFVKAYSSCLFFATKQILELRQIAQLVDGVE